MDIDAAQLAETIAAALTERQGAEIGRGNVQPNSRFAHFPVRLPNGQTFVIKIEESW